MESIVARPVCVESIEDEDRVFGICSCGSTWSVAHEDVVPLRGRWYDALVMKCRSCGAVVQAVFDVTPFFQPATFAWVRSA